MCLCYWFPERSRSAADTREDRVANAMVDSVEDGSAGSGRPDVGHQEGLHRLGRIDQPVTLPTCIDTNSVNLRVRPLVAPTAAEGNGDQAEPDTVNDHLDALPLVAGDAGLAKDASQEADANIAAMRVGDRDHDVGADHELMPSTRVGAVEAEGSQSADELAARGRSPRRHQPAFWTLISMSSSGGIASPWETLTRTHSSMTSASWS